MVRWCGSGVVALLSMAAPAGCSLLVSTDGLSSAAGATAPLDAASESGPGDAALLDGSTTADATDGQPAGGFCDSVNPKPTFCADFDTGALETFALVGGPTLDPTFARSPPRSLMAVVEQGAVERFARVEHPLSVSPTYAAVSLQVFLDEYDAGKDLEIGGLLLKPSNGSSCALFAAVRSGRWTADQYCQTSGTTTASNVGTSSAAGVMGRWFALTLVLDLEKRHLSLSVDGVIVIDSRPLDAAVVFAPATVYVGLAYVSVDATRTRLHVDNLTVEAR